MSAAQAVLAPDENALATLEVDLSAELRFAAGRVILTEQRLLACEPGTDTWRAWPLTAGLQLRLLEHGGVGTAASPADMLRELKAPHVRPDRRHPGL